MAELQLELAQENITAMKELLQWYEIGKTRLGCCPLCVVNHSISDCLACPWLKLAGRPCTHIDCMVRTKRKLRDPAWTARRIPELKEWIRIYKTWEKSK